LFGFGDGEGIAFPGSGVSSSVSDFSMPPVPLAQIFALAVQHLQAGRLAEAETLYRQVLAAQPDHPHALHHLGIIAHQSGRSDLAVDWIRRVTTMVPEDPAAHFNLGEAHRALGQLDEAMASFRQALRLRPDWAEAHHGLGFVLAVRGDRDEAAAAYRRALELRPDFPAAWHNLGNLLREGGRLEEAVAAYERALALQPELAETQNSRGVALAGLGRSEEAMAAYRHAMELRPDYAQASNNLGNALKERNQLEAALTAYRRALALQPDYADAWNNLGAALGGLNRWDEAMAAYRRVLETDPAHVEAQNNLGNALKEQDQLDAAAVCYERALALDSSFADGHLNLGVVWWLKGRYAEAEVCYRRAIELRADLAGAHLSLGMLLLFRGRYEEGWREYEWRGRAPAYAGFRRPFSVSQWDGRPAPGKTLLIHAEQGFGDTLLFLRYVELARVQSQAARVILACYPELLCLLEPLRGRGMEVVPFPAVDEGWPPLDLHVPLPGLPLALETFAPVPMGAPLLEADAGLRARWRERLGEQKGFRVGLVWAGNPGQSDDRRRSIAPEMLAPILRVPGVRFISLQVKISEPLAAQIASLGIQDFHETLSSFSHTAALMAELDLIITVDTAAAHLAGTLGRPVWVMLPFVPYWPYGPSREDSAWYPTMRLFRQTAPGDWTGVMERVAIALREHLVG